MDERHARSYDEFRPPFRLTDPMSAVAEFAVSIEQLDDQTVVLAVSGEVDLATAPEFEQCLADAMGNAAHVIVDLTNCDFFDSTGLNVLVRAKHHLDGSVTLSLIVPPDAAPRRAFEIARLDRMFEIFPGLKAAIDGRSGRAAATPREQTDGSQEIADGRHSGPGG